MRNLTLARSIAALGTLAAAGWGGQAYAVEPGSSDPHLPGVSAGVPAGAVAPPGFYFVNTLAYNDGSLQDGNGNPVKFGGVTGINATAWIEIPALVWSAPFHFAGASFAAAIAQPIVTLSVTTNTVVGQATVNKTGLFNTVITPVIASWHLPLGFFVSGNFSVYINDADNGDRGNGTSSQTHIANNTWTFAPGAAVSWFNGHGLELSLNGEYDIQTQDTNFAPGVKYQSGDVLNLDFTAQQVLPGAYKKWTVGVVGFYSKQVNNDQVTAGGVTVDVAQVPGLNGTGNQFERAGIGPIVGYEFGPVALQAYYIRDVEAKNATLGDTFFIRFAVPL
jgi:hypothetical protein